jgi:hypothetical protein
LPRRYDDEGDDLYHQVYQEVNPKTYMINKTVIKKEVKHTTNIYKNVIETAPQVLATYHTSPIDMTEQ